MESESPILDGFREQVEERLVDYLSLSDDCPDQLGAAMRYSVLAGGKRLRPILVCLACEACGGDPQQALPAACAIEMVHTYSLIHDDLPAMDDDTLRRGKPTCHVQFGEATAILAGDALLTLAFEILARDVQPADVAAACCVELANASGPVGMVAGQQADLEAETAGVHTVDQLERIHRRKTGRLLTAALLMGGRIAGASSEILDRLKIYGKAVGLAFQIADDLLDVTGNEQTLGKRAQKDAGQGKLTYPALLGVQDSRKRAEELIAEACEALEPLGEKRTTLTQLARYIIERDR